MGDRSDNSMSDAGTVQTGQFITHCTLSQWEREWKNDVDTNKTLHMFPKQKDIGTEDTTWVSPSFR